MVKRSKIDLKKGEEGDNVQSPNPKLHVIQDAITACHVRINEEHNVHDKNYLL